MTTPARKTMQQIADDLNLARVTVSLVINGHARKRGVSDKTVERVNSYLKKVGYVASRGALALRTGKRVGVGILHRGHLYTHLTQAFNQLTDVLSETPDGIEIVVRPSSAILDGLREMVSRGVERLVWVQNGALVIPREIREEVLTLGGKLRTVVYNHHFNREDDDREMLARGFSLVGMNRAGGYAQMARFLAQGGHRHILLADAYADSPHLLDQQLHKEMTALGLHAHFASWPAPQNPIPVERGTAIGQQIAGAFKKGRYSAICFRDDEVAGGAIAELLSSGIKVPGDIAVVSMDGHPLSGIFQVPLTTLAVPVDAMVQKTIELVRENGAPGVFLFPYKVIERGSHLLPKKRRFGSG